MRFGLWMALGVLWLSACAITGGDLIVRVNGRIPDVAVDDHQGVVCKMDAVSVRSGERSVRRREVLDLLGFFYRYNISMAQLRVLDSPEFSSLLRDPDAYWNYRMFRSKEAAARVITGEAGS
jgi:hypothetical protein